MMRRLTSLVFVFAAMATALPAMADDYRDVAPDDPHRADIEWLEEAGITRGCNPPENDRFCPTSGLTRGQMAAFLHRALPLLPTDPRLSPFHDTQISVFAADVDWLADTGITRGCNPPDNDRFCPEQVVSRGEMAAFLARALDLGSSETEFIDSRSHPFAAEIGALADHGLARGCDPPANAYFCPERPVTRAEMASFLRRASILWKEAPLSLHHLSVPAGGSQAATAYCSMTSLDRPISATRLVVVVHGSGRNSCDYADRVIDASVSAGVSQETLVVAPRFSIPDDDPTGPEQLYWSDSGWKSGAPSLDAASLSSFAVIDTLIAHATTSLVGLEEVVMVGHSAGGQFVNRYAAAAPDADGIRFISANPSSYLYLDHERWDGTAFRPLTPAEIAECPYFNDYKYGLADLDPYLDRLGAETIRRQYGSRRVTYLLGQDDTDTIDPSLDDTCAGRWQGDHRLERGIRYFEHLQEVYGTQITEVHTVSFVEGVGHVGRDMLTSPEGQEAMFAR